MSEDFFKTLMDRLMERDVRIHNDIAMWTGIVAGNILKSADEIKNADCLESQQLEFHILRGKLEDGMRELNKLNTRREMVEEFQEMIETFIKGELK